MLSPRYKKGVFALLWISFLLMIPFFLRLVNIIDWDIYGTLIFPSIFLLITFITFLFGVSEPNKVNGFMEKRSLIKWKYSAEEWRAIMKKQKKEQQGDWKFMLIFFASLSLIISIILGLTTKNIELSVYILAGGIVFGSGLSLINHLCDISEFNSKINNPGETAIGEGEFFYNDIYFKDNSKGSFLRKKIKDAKLAVIEHKKYLIITTMEQRFNKYSAFTKTYQTFHILTPEKEYKSLHELLPKIRTTD